jgi:hypothetical protein
MCVSEYTHICNLTYYRDRDSARCFIAAANRVSLSIAARQSIGIQNAPNEGWGALGTRGKREPLRVVELRLAASSCKCNS